MSCPPPMASDMEARLEEVELFGKLLQFEHLEAPGSLTTTV